MLGRVAGRIGPSHHLAVVIDVIGLAVISSQGAKVSHAAIAVKEGVLGSIAGRIGPSHRLAIVIDTQSSAIISPQGA